MTKEEMLLLAQKVRDNKASEEEEVAFLDALDESLNGIAAILTASNKKQ